MNFAPHSTAYFFTALALFLPSVHVNAAECDIVAAYCSADDYYYDICASCTDGDCWDELMAAITAAGMTYQGDESLGQGALTCLDEPCASGNPGCPGMAFRDGQLYYDTRSPWRVGVHVVCCNGCVVKAAATGKSYCEAFTRAKATAFRLASKKCLCCPTPGIRCYYPKTLVAPSGTCYKTKCQTSKRIRGLRGLLGRPRRR